MSRTAVQVLGVALVASMLVLVPQMVFSASPAAAADTVTMRIVGAVGDCDVNDDSLYRCARRLPGAQVTVTQVLRNGERVPVGTGTTDANGKYSITGQVIDEGQFTAFALEATHEGYWGQSTTKRPPSPLPETWKVDERWTTEFGLVRTDETATPTFRGKVRECDDFVGICENLAGATVKLVQQMGDGTTHPVGVATSKAAGKWQITGTVRRDGPDRVRQERSQLHLTVKHPGYKTATETSFPLFGQDGSSAGAWDVNLRSSFDDAPTNVRAHRVVDDPTALRVEFTPVEADVVSYQATCRTGSGGVVGTASARPGKRLKVVGLSPGAPYTCAVRAVVEPSSGPYSGRSPTVWTGGQYAIDVSGVVRDRFGEPLAGATVVLRSDSSSRGAPEPHCTVKTDRHGRYAMRNRKCFGTGTPTHTVTAHKADYNGIATISPGSQTFSNESKVTRWVPSTADFTLAKVKGNVFRGSVRDQNGPVSGAQVIASFHGGPSHERVTDGKGTYKHSWANSVTVEHGSQRLSLVRSDRYQTYHWVGVVHFRFD